jgi:hypothetical protein
VDNQQMSQELGINVNLVTMAVFGWGRSWPPSPGWSAAPHGRLSGLDFRCAFAIVVIVGAWAA